MQAFELSLAFSDHSLLVWRRVLVPLSWHFGQLGQFLYTTLNYSGDASFEFIFPKKKERITNDAQLLKDAAFLKSEAGKTYLQIAKEKDFAVDESVQVFAADNIPLVSKLEADERFIFLYDFTDEWTYDVTVRSVKQVAQAPFLLDGQGTAPFEASGGRAAFDELMAIITDPHHVSGNDIRWWMEKQNLKLFDLQDTQKEIENQIKMGLL